MKVDTGIAGSYCVVWINDNHYLDARKDVRASHLTFIELVRDGQVYFRDAVLSSEAPEHIIEHIRPYMRSAPGTIRT